MQKYEDLEDTGMFPQRTLAATTFESLFSSNLNISPPNPPKGDTPLHAPVPRKPLQKPAFNNATISYLQFAVNSCIEPYDSIQQHLPPQFYLPRVYGFLRRFYALFEISMTGYERAITMGLAWDGKMWNCSSLGSVDDIWEELTMEVGVYMQTKAAIVGHGAGLSEKEMQDQLIPLLNRYEPTLRLFAGLQLMQAMLVLVKKNPIVRELFRKADVQIPECFSDVERLLQGGTLDNYY
ncbi:hypothetical protein BJ508DRAFT_310412 [Ascobolus immersus RN42]|uniref:Uncharacterized protein n=1 Tax=Ascobolus immersus RN42 TaxID=1160509 RepID=A0A3N4HYX2_ASCIM|nr:hypothetical protein BJ508DRAFT_310412 [Ascobolus immersus RN42]